MDVTFARIACDDKKLRAINICTHINMHIKMYAHKYVCIYTYINACMQAFKCTNAPPWANATDLLC